MRHTKPKARITGGTIKFRTPEITILELQAGRVFAEILRKGEAKKQMGSV